MSAATTGLAIASSLVLPWLIGSLCCLWLLRRSGRYNFAVVLGQGYLLGILVTTLLLHVWGTLGLPLHFWRLAGVLLVLCFCGAIALKLQNPVPRKIQGNNSIPAWQLATACALIGLMLFRYATIIEEIALRPLFPWDAWMNWAPKSIVWFYQGQFTEFVSPRDWLFDPENRDAYTLGATGVWRFPVVVPLIQLWGMLATGAADHNLIYSPWVLVAIAMGLSLYGYLRLAGCSFLTALTACYLLLNLPYLNVHTALTGYADIWITAAFFGSVLALQQWERHREPSQAIIALLIAALCTQMKIPGLIFGGFILVSFLLTACNVFQSKRLIAFAVLAAVGLLILAYGVDIQLAEGQRLRLSMSGMTIPYIGSYNFSYHPVHTAVLDTLFLMINWHLLWYIFVGALIYSILYYSTIRLPVTLILNLGMSLLFILFVYYFTERYRFAEDYSQINRALIYLTPLLVLFLAFSSSGSQRQVHPDLK